MPLRPFAAGLVLIGGLLLTACAATTPKIVAITPNRDARDVASNQDIRITFDRTMDQASVESHFELRPKLAGCDADRCRLFWAGNTLTYSHAGVNFALATTYTVALHAGYADSRGRRNDLEHTWSFTSEGPPALDRVDPPDRAVGIATDRNLILTFNHPMDPVSMRMAVTLSPDAPFVLRRRPGDDTTQFEVVPVGLLQPNTPYAISVEGAQDRHQNTTLGRVQSRFTTGPHTVARRLGYLVGQRGLPGIGVAVVDPHPDPFLGLPTPKLLYALADDDRATQAVLQFDWSPDGARLVVVQGVRGATEGQLLIVSLRTGQAQELQGVVGSEAVWSPDGSTIVYRRRGDLHRYRLDRRTDVPLTQDGTALAPITFSPDGKSIAYAGEDATGLPRLWIVNLDLRARSRLPGLDDPADRPAWSPDGLKIAFRRIAPGGPYLAVQDRSTGSIRNAAALDARTIAWLNDSSTVIVGVGSGADGGLYRVNIFAPGEAGGLVKVTGSRDAPNGSYASAPLYDRRIGFTVIRDGAPQIFVMNADGSRPQQLTLWEQDFPYTGESPNWNPSG